jgi:hypothetical protein
MPWFSSQKDRISWQIFSKNGCDLPNYYVSLVWGLNTLRRRTVTGRPWLLRHVVLHISCHSDRGVQDQWCNDDGFSQQHGEVWRIFPSKLLETFFFATWLGPRNTSETVKHVSLSKSGIYTVYHSIPRMLNYPPASGQFDVEHQQFSRSFS